MINNNIKHILISRTDNIGDVILTLPLTGIFKKYFPNTKISFLARDYVRAVVEHCVHVDEFVSYDALSKMLHDESVTFLQKREIDAVVFAFAKKEIAVLMKQAGVRYRIGTSRRFYHWWTCNERVNFSRKKSGLHEAQLNLQLLKAFQITPENNLHYLNDMMGLQCNESLVPHLENIIRADRFNLIVHPFTNGHTREWPTSHFNALIRQLPPNRFNVIITGSATENTQIQERMISQCPTVNNVAGQCNLGELMQLMMHCDGLIANATGPMHLAAGLGIRTLGLFPATKGIDPNRWGPVGKRAEFLMADPNCNSLCCRVKHDCFCMKSITVDQVKKVVMCWLK